MTWHLSFQAHRIDQAVREQTARAKTKTLFPAPARSRNKKKDAHLSGGRSGYRRADSSGPASLALPSQGCEGDPQESKASRLGNLPTSVELKVGVDKRVYAVRLGEDEPHDTGARDAELCEEERRHAVAVDQRTGCVERLHQKIDCAEAPPPQRWTRC